jgi:hypothetical protein
VDLTQLQASSDLRRHAAHKGEAGVRVSARRRCSVTLADKVRKPPHEPIYKEKRGYSV